tara:strand:- start:143 stop:514 length:372 start_codon:yes stop_codon:yes gene_type:complete
VGVRPVAGRDERNLAVRRSVCLKNRRACGAQKKPGSLRSPGHTFVTFWNGVLRLAVRNVLPFGLTQAAAWRAAASVAWTFHLSRVIRISPTGFVRNAVSLAAAATEQHGEPSRPAVIVRVYRR